MSREIEQYKDYRIKFNPAIVKSDFDDFGWTFQVFKDDMSLFTLIIKTIRYYKDPQDNKKFLDDKKFVLDWGMKKIHYLLDKQSYEKRAEYCYKWVDFVMIDKGCTLGVT